VIVASLVLILGAVVLLVLGLISGSSGLLVGSIGTSLLAAVALVVGVRQAGAARAAAGLDDEDEQFDSDEVEEWSHRSAGQRSYQEEEPARALVPPRGEPGGWGDEPVLAASSVSVPSQPVHDRSGDRPAQDDLDDEDPPDEPMSQRVSAADAARVARMSADVLVIDGRPRYHVPGCVHLLGRPCEPLAVSEAVELGFSPCGLCEPDSALLADARRV
jgi:hypothetical protein